MTTMEPQARQFGLLTDWDLSVLAGVEPADGRSILSEHTNGLEWLAGRWLAPAFSKRLVRGKRRLAGAVRGA